MSFNVFKAESLMQIFSTGSWTTYH